MRARAGLADFVMRILVRNRIRSDQICADSVPIDRNTPQRRLPAPISGKRLVRGFGGPRHGSNANAVELTRPSLVCARDEAVDGAAAQLLAGAGCTG